MSIAPVAYVSQAPSADATSSMRYDDSSSADAFAGILSSAMNSSPAQIDKPATKPEGTSELDAKEDADENGDKDSTESTSESNNTKHVSARSHAAPSPNDVVRSVSALDPELQAKLSRVMQRMRDETGHDVNVTETYRSQSRQNALFAQGRTANGPVVTWTQNSKHSQGRAVDVELDSGSAPKSAYTALQRIANEEGLGTLGARDPGHLELRGNGAKVGNLASNIPAAPADATGEGQMPVARLATVARVSDVQVATPAPVARVAPVAQPGQSPSVAAIARAAAHGKHGDTAGDGQRGSQNSQGDSRSYASMVTMRIHNDTSATTFPTAAVSATPSDAVARAEKIMNAMDSVPVRPLSQITMNVDAGNGMTDRVHVAMRGSSLSAAIDTGDTRVAQLLNNRADELSRALSRDGIELRELRARAATDTGTVTAAANAQSSQSPGDASTHSRFDRSETDQRQQEQQDRQRGQQRNRQQQRQQRGDRQ